MNAHYTKGDHVSSDKSSGEIILHRVATKKNVQKTL
jgi:hypothetical protein